MTTAIRFSGQNDAGLRASNTQYWENLALVVVLVSESKVLFYGRIIIYLDKTTDRNHLFFSSIPALRLLWPGFENEIFQSSLRKQPTFLDATNDGVPAKWRLRSECRASILMTCRYPDLRWASDWLKHISHEARDTSSVWYFCARSLHVISRGIPKCRPFLQARFSTTTSLYVLNTALCIFIFGSGGCFWRPSESNK